MTKPKSKVTDDKMLTEVELELMTILWRLGEGSVTEVIAGLSSGRDLAYTSVSTILRILEQKGVLGTRKEGRGHIYIPLLTKDDYEMRTLKHMVDRVFDGTPLSLAKQLITSAGMSKKDLLELKEMISKAEGKSK
jgi:predicted transcriptional regulator